MKDIVEILRQQLVLCKRLLELAQAQKIELVKTDAVAARKLTGTMEPIMAEINSLEKRKEKLMSSRGENSLPVWLSKLPDSPEKEVLDTLIKKQEIVLQELKKVNSDNLQYLNRHAEFIDYNINVMTQTSAGVTYGTPGDAGGMPVQGRKMFDAGV